MIDFAPKFTFFCYATFSYCFYLSLQTLLLKCFFFSARPNWQSTKRKLKKLKAGWELIWTNQKRSDKYEMYVGWHVYWIIWELFHTLCCIRGYGSTGWRHSVAHWPLRMWEDRNCSSPCQGFGFSDPRVVKSLHHHSVQNWEFVHAKLWSRSGVIFLLVAVRDWCSCCDTTIRYSKSMIII